MIPAQDKTAFVDLVAPQRMTAPLRGFSMRDLLTEYLNEYGYEVTCAANGQDALEIYKQGHFDIVLSDHMMEPMDGLELLNRIKEINPDAIFIMITGYPSIEVSIEAIKKARRITSPSLSILMKSR